MEERRRRKSSRVPSRRQTVPAETSRVRAVQGKNTSTAVGRKPPRPDFCSPFPRGFKQRSSICQSTSRFSALKNFRWPDGPKVFPSATFQAVLVPVVVIDAVTAVGLSLDGACSHIPASSPASRAGVFKNLSSLNTAFPACPVELDEICLKSHIICDTCQEKSIYSPKQCRIPM